MDWSKAKTILILAFIVLNIFLGLQVWEDRQQQSIQGQISPLMIDDIKDKLKSANITVMQPLETIRYEMGYLSVTSKTFQQADFSKIPFQSTSWEQEKDALQVVLKSPVALNYSMTSEERAKAIEPNVLYFDQYAYDPYQSSMDKMVFTQQINGYPVFSSLLVLTIEEDGWKSYRQNFYEVVSKGEKREIISGYTALAVLFENGMLKHGEVVNDVRLGYYSEGYNTDENPLVPVWRICHTLDGQMVIHYINGITGAIIVQK